MAWLAQIVLFLMLGLLVTPEELPPYLPGAVIGAAVLILLARPVAVFFCLLPFKFNLRETAFASWVGLRGAVPIYLSIIPGLADPHRDQRLFASVAGRARLDRGPGRPSARFWTPAMNNESLPGHRRLRPICRVQREERSLPGSTSGQGFRCDAESGQSAR